MNLDEEKETDNSYTIYHPWTAGYKRKKTINENVGTDIDGRTTTSDQANGRQTLERKDGIEIHPEVLMKAEWWNDTGHKANILVRITTKSDGTTYDEGDGSNKNDIHNKKLWEKVLWYSRSPFIKNVNLTWGNVPTDFFPSEFLLLGTEWKWTRKNDGLHHNFCHGRHWLRLAFAFLRLRCSRKYDAVPNLPET